MAQNPSQQLLEKIVSLAKRRGFIFQSSEIYGGLNGCWDYGPLGVEMLRNLKDAWWRSMTYRRDMEGVDASILMHPRVWEASGHIQNFSDPMVDCRECKSRYRVDHLFQEMSEKKLRGIAKAIGLDLAVQKTLNTDSKDLSKDELADIIVGMTEQNQELFQSLVEQELIPCPNCGRVKTFTAPNLDLQFSATYPPDSAWKPMYNYRTDWSGTRYTMIAEAGYLRTGDSTHSQYTSPSFYFRSIRAGDNTGTRNSLVSNVKRLDVH